jgi:glyoxylate reductase
MKKSPEDIKILVTRIFPETGIELMRKEGFNVTVWDHDWPMTQTELIARSLDSNALYCTVTENIDSHFLGKCSHLDIISQFAVGYDNIDIEEATRLGIPVGFTPDVLSDATADVAFGLMIAASRKMFHLHKTILRGRWDYFRPKAGLGIELKDKTLGIFGLGRIGMEMAKRCRGAYNMKIIYCNRHRNETAEKLLDARPVTMDRLLESSDVISVHCTLSDETKGLFDRHAFKKMKSTAIFVNTSRGAVHNEHDLAEALKKGIIWGAGLDVTNPEPMKPDNPLLDLENVAVLPHIGSATVETRNKMSLMAASNIIEYYKNRRVPNIINPDALDRK